MRFSGVGGGGVSPAGASAEGVSAAGASASAAPLAAGSLTAATPSVETAITFSSSAAPSRRAASANGTGSVARGAGGAVPGAGAALASAGVTSPDCWPAIWAESAFSSAIFALMRSSGAASAAMSAGTGMGVGRFTSKAGRVAALAPAGTGRSKLRSFTASWPVILAMMRARLLVSLVSSAASARRDAISASLAIRSFDMTMARLRWRVTCAVFSAAWARASSSRNSSRRVAMAFWARSASRSACMSRMVVGTSRLRL